MIGNMGTSIRYYQTEALLGVTLWDQFRSTWNLCPKELVELESNHCSHTVGVGGWEDRWLRDKQRHEAFTIMPYGYDSSKH